MLRFCFWLQRARFCFKMARIDLEIEVIYLCGIQFYKGLLTMSSVIPPSRDWMYKRLTSSRALIPTFIDGVLGFVEYASGRDEYRRNNYTMRYPCEKCKCKKHWNSSDDVTMDLMDYGFMPDY